jgi:hypothetical protein
MAQVQAPPWLPCGVFCWQRSSALVAEKASLE